MIATIVDDGHIHQATLDGLEVAWTLDGAFQRQLSYDSILHSVSHAPIEHIVFARFRESSGAETPTVALCVFRPDMLHICYHTGEKFVVALPFGVCRVFSMYIGILVQREYSDATDSGIHTGKLPTIFSLMSPFSEFKMLGLNKTMDLASACRQSRRSFVLSPTAVEGSPMPPIGDQIVGFNDSKSVLVGVATSRRNRSSQFVLCWESSAKKYVLYRCFVAYSSPEADDDTQDALQPADAQHALGQPGSQRHGHRHSSVSAHRRQSTVMARNDSRRSTIGLAITNERRVSILGRASINESPGARSVIDTFWENRQMRAEVVLHECWRERRQRADRSDSAVLKSKVSVMQAVNGDDIVCVLRMGDAPLAIGLDTTRFGEVFKIPATSMASIGATRSELDDLAVVMTSGSLGLVCAGHEPVLYDVPCNGSITQILRVEGSSAVLELEDGSETTVQISIEMTRLSVAIMGALSFVLSPATYATTRRAMITALQDAATADDELECLVSLLLNGCYTQSNIVLSPRAMDEVRARAAAVVSVLHLVYEDMAMRAFEPRARLCKLGKALVQISQQNGLNEIARYYAPIGLPTLSSLELAAAQARRTASVPSFIQWATKALDGSPETATDKFPDFAAIANLYRITDAVPAFGAHSLLTILGTVSEVLMQLASQLDLAEILKPMADLGIDPVMFLPRLAPAYQWLLRALIECSRNQCLLHWPQNILKMLGRNDIVANMSPKSAVFPQRCLSKGNLSDADDEVEPATIAQLCESVIDTASTLVRAEDVIESAVKSQEIGQMCFAQDLRVDEACRLLLVHADVHINVDVSRLESPEEIKQIKDKHLTQVAQRTLSLPVSQALLTFSTRDLDEQDSLAIPQVTVRAKFRGNRMPSIWKPADVDTAWAQFHNGVAVALSLDRDQVRGAHPSWVLLNWPVEAFKYLSSRDGLTSIGLLLGCACANRGSMDPAAAKLLSLHIPSLLPPGSSELMLLLHGTQAAAMLGLGLVYAGSQNRRMVEVALRELTACRTAPPSDDAANRLDDADPAESSLECYSLASGFALGLLVLGQGQVTETLADLNLLDTLSGMIGRQGGGNRAHWETGRYASCMG
ncbi:Anaphase-promoting complex subunit 1 [Linderina macrospora]|uniref:Anaphase-promoting complex subunit 1 n=1 Tax=Linderina macrospora TaxID=4868 RepID=A0ACC1JE46_9FUNG|nr:Anaphase-promoting complex subunit 1 [Linderina macrospora]